MNYGLKFDTPDPTHWVLGGGNTDSEVINPTKDWREYNPQPEYQNRGFEPYACVLFTILNCVETLIYFKYGVIANFSDRFLAAGVGTQWGGTTPQKGAEFLRKHGVPQEHQYPYVADQAEFFQTIPKKIERLAKEFTAQWEFSHEFVQPTPDQLSFALKLSPLLISVPAWFERNGKYYRPDNYQDNHATTLVFEQPNEYRQVFDSYADNQGDPALKELEWGVLPMVAKRFSVNKRKTPALNWDWRKLFCW